jgi:HEAT repeat protein
MRPYLQELLDRMTDQTPYTDSTQSTSWQAFREAERLIDRSLVDELVTYVATEKVARNRAAAHFIIGKIGATLKDGTCADILIQLCTTERDKYGLSALLEHIGEIPKAPETDLSTIYALLRDKRWLVRRSAIDALRNTSNPQAEAQILSLLAEVTDPYDITSCHAVLNRIGTSDSLPLLERSLSSSKRDVKLSAKLAIAAINSRSDS